MGTYRRLTPHSAMLGRSVIMVSSSAFGRLRRNETNCILTSCYIHFKTFRENVDVMDWFFSFCFFTILSSLQFNHSVLSDSLQSHGLQHARPPCPSPTPGVYSNSSIDSVMHINFMLSPRGFPPGKRASSRKRLKPLRLQGCGGGYAPSTVTHFLPTLHGVPARPPLHPNPGAVGASPPDTWAPRPRIPLLLAGGPGRTHSHPTPRASSL